jgi:ribosome recycling factor
LEAVNTAIKESKLELNPRVDGNAVTGKPRGLLVLEGFV